MNIQNVTASKGKAGGYIYYAPLGTTLPTDATSALPDAYKSLGYISEDGVTNANSADTEDIYDWNGDPVLSITNNKEDRFTLTLMEALSTDVMKVVFGEGNVTETDSLVTITANNDAAGEFAFVIDMRMRGGLAYRLVIANGRAVLSSDRTFVKNEALSYEIEISALQDSSGNTHYEYIQKEAATSGSGD